MILTDWLHTIITARQHSLLSRELY